MRRVPSAVWILKIAVLAFALVPAFYAHAEEQGLETQLRPVYEQKLLSLRTPYFGKTLSFDSSGVPINQLVTGPWSTCGLLQVEKLRVTQDGVEIDGERAILVLRSAGGNGLETTPAKLEVAPILTRKAVHIRIQMSPANVNQVNGILSQVFQGGQLLDRVAAYWKPMTSDLKAFHRQTPNGVLGELEGKRPVYFINRGVVEPPKPVDRPSPECTEAARKKKLQGTAILSIVINEKGFPEILEITKGLGEGLDIQAIAAVANWRFEPALRDGRPVAVQAYVEVKFHLR